MTTTALMLQAAILISLFGATGCASMPATEAEPNPVTTAVEQPFRDLNVIRRDSPPAVAKAAMAPYALPVGEDCEHLALTIAALNKELGPDLDVAQGKHPTIADDLLGDTVGSALHLPFRGILRSVTGAAQHDRLLAAAVMAGIARRAFLRGIAAERGCDLQPKAD